jgi:hypothetical protein
MKKASICIGVFLVLFLMIGISADTAQAQDIRSYDGTWLQLNYKTKTGYEFASGGWESTLVPKKHMSRQEKWYVCIQVDQTDLGEGATYKSGYLRIFNSAGKEIGCGDFSWENGTNTELLAYVELRTGNDYVVDPITPTQVCGTGYDTYTYAGFLWTDKNGKINFKSFYGEGEYQPATTDATNGPYAWFGLDLKGITAKGNNVPPAACGWVAPAPG